ncbi:TRAP transporter permease [Arthrobacter crystallopoietes]|jgi:TRAP transporter 4TM/12TM fusion protein|uniref:TRAP transporter, 4TM/12TM fusion protein n=1 Tax=Crystallibacter crystallopoietes TaxID=37928 RepID=A0A1H1ANH8_9MICC|nr:TRAP transporter fused permease subunit [Arthrobacter crystallopoietes]AUI51462.1 C4-dicarboxylate ABC transporter permease [Arthrobacter crystallopoietes]SDQ41142.1 TRAP transporter, 4TM/12TM fusion protein [Arthrobacter crystallopoietes]
MTERPDGNGAVTARASRPEDPRHAHHEDPHESNDEANSELNVKAQNDPGNDSIDEEALIAEFEAEKPARHLSGKPKLVVQVLGVSLSLFALYWVFNPMATQFYLPAFLMLGLSLTFLVYRGWGRTSQAQESGRADNPHIVDWVLAIVAIVPFLYIISDWDAFFRRAIIPTYLDLIMGTIAILLVLEACRRTVGILVPAVVMFFFAYAYFGPYFPDPFQTSAFGWIRLVGHNVMGTQGIFGVPTDVAATYIILFTIYGAVLGASGATKFFIDLSFSAFGQSRSGPGRTVTLAGFLLGTVSGSGVATTVTLGGISWPLLRKAGYPKEHGGAVLAAAGIGAIMSPPTLGAAAFIIAALLNVSYLEVLIWATIPTLLYYLGIILAIEMDARRFKTKAVDFDAKPVGKLLLRFGYHFSSLIAIVVFMALGMTPFRAVVYATMLAFVLSFFDRESWMTPKRIWDALATGATGALSVIPVMAAAGLIVGVMTLTGLGLKLANIIVDFAGGSLFLTALFSAISVILLGLAVPVTASFIISWVIIGPALQDVGVPAFAAAMFIFYYSVLSEVSPPTALSPFAASAITGGKPIPTMWLTWRYTLSAFLVPFIFVLSGPGIGLLMQGGIGTVLLALAVSATAVAALAVATGGWIIGPANWLERAVIGLGSLPLLVMEPMFLAVGAGAIAVGLLLHVIRIKRRSHDEPAAPAAASTP